ncbi:MAG: hypothetical protein COA73_05385 [Candidatus Hydrogenedentota bacterium]|nr:MAG: hypothetical protein COA73_05385 [Candidatus Hydrogenedentota bacterium]
MKKLFKLVFVGGFILLLVGVGGAYFYRNTIVKTAIEEASTFALGVETTLDSANLQLGGGSLTMDGLTVSNPEGFKNPTFMELGRGHIKIDAGSLREKRIEVPILSLENIALSIDKSEGKANYEAIIDNLSRFDTGDAAPVETDFVVVINEIVIKNVAVTASLLPIGGELSRSTFNIDEIRIVDLRSDEGMTIPEIVSIVMKALLANVFKSGGGILPDELMNGLGSALGGLGDLGSIGVDLVDKATGEILNSTKDVGDTLKDAGKKLFNRKKD